MKYQYFVAGRWRNRDNVLELVKTCILIGEQKEAESLYLIFDEFYKTVDEFIESLG